MAFGDDEALAARLRHFKESGERPAEQRAATFENGCTTEGERALGTGTGTEYVERIVYKSVDAHVFADFTAERAVVMSETDCSVLADLNF
jgi:hypothetical protein